MMYRRLRPSSLLRRAGTSFLLGFSVFLLGIFLESALKKFSINGITALVDDLLIGILAGAVVFAYEQHRHTAMLRQMRVIAEMNHHIRNALQPILYSPYLKEQAEQIKIIQQGTDRIQWALKEVLQGELKESPLFSGSKTAA
jgi:hypothetical protein